ncbi:hypothetical protein BGX31_000451 [Mortierella sp. GBA43]|nr:hypothetical protein BGX31_000451 [Mortierella sp. GBA43]
MESSSKSTRAKAGATKAGSWRNFLGDLPARSYFEGCKTIAEIDYIGFLRFSERQRLTKDQGLIRDQCESQWTEAISRLFDNSHSGIQKHAMFLKKQWDNRAHVDEADLFWSKVKRKRGLDKGTLSVQEAVDTFWNKRIRKEYEQDTDTFSDAEPTSSSSMTQSSSAMPNPFLSESDAWQDFAYFTAFGQKPTWTCGTDGPSAVDYLPLFKEYQAAKKESLALDMIADVSTNGSDPGTFTEWIKKSHGYPGLKSARFRAPISRSIQDIWPTFDTVMERVFAAGIVSYDDVCHSIAKEPDQLDPIVKYCTAVVSSYMHHFTFGNAVSRDVNEREAFVDCTWCFIRGALTIAKIPSRMLEVQIDGNKDRKEETKNGARQSTPRKADGVGLFNSNQIYVAEAARVYGAALDKKSDDAWKVKRAMRDSWVSQLRRICETERPTSPLMVFGSTSHLHTTKFYVMDFVGCFRVSLLSSMAVPLESGDFARKMKACILTCLNFAITLMDEMNNRKKTTLIQSEEEREELLELAASIPMTSMTPTKLLKY